MKVRNDQSAIVSISDDMCQKVINSERMVVISDWNRQPTRFTNRNPTIHFQSGMKGQRNAEHDRS